MLQVQSALASAAALPWQRPPAPRSLAPEEGALRLGKAWFRVRSFETRRPGEPATAPPRTVGHVCLQLGRPLPVAAGAAEAALVGVRRGGPPPSEESAREKVVFCGPLGDTLVYQADRAGGTAALCACGNASGASAALLAQALGRARVRQDLVLPDGAVGMQAHVRPVSARLSSTPSAHGAGWLVEQSWVGVHFEALADRLLGYPVAVCTGTLNDYLIVALPDESALDAFGLDDALAFWEQARQHGGFDDPLRSRLAALTCAGPIPRAKFFTCGRAHPGAPLTGLAALSLAAARFDWLAPLARAGRVEHRRGTDALPAVRNAADGAQIDLPPIHVLLRA